jgi:DNA replicative helicase MCM subunit Mcm2 (Cdc46/Mcm family)
MSSGVGLTASIGSGENSKDMCLQPGAAITADRGILCIGTNGFCPNFIKKFVFR